MSTEQPITAFPVQDNSLVDGMSLRDYFAAKAMAAIVGTTNTETMARVDLIAECAYEYADAMLKAREITSPQ